MIYWIDDSILNPSGKGKHTEVTETEKDGRSLKQNCSVSRYD